MIALSHLLPRSFPAHCGGTLLRRFKNVSTVTTIRPAPDAPREAPTPLVFLSSSRWDPRSKVGLSEVAYRLASKGFMSLDCDLDVPTPINDSRLLMKHFVSELLDSISRSQLAPFPPIVFARSTGALIAQTYISSHRATGLFLISPPPSNDDVADLLPTALDEFNFEMKFPMAVLGTNQDVEAIQRRRDLDSTGYVNTYVVPRIDEDSITANAEEWLDELGV